MKKSLDFFVYLVIYCLKFSDFIFFYVNPIFMAFFHNMPYNIVGREKFFIFRLDK